MARPRKTFWRICLIFIVIIPLAGFSHFLAFPRETRSMLIYFSDFKKSGRIYYSPNSSFHTVDSLERLIGLASLRVSNFWGSKISDPRFIYCETDEEFSRFAVPAVPAVTYTKLGAVIVLKRESMDLDIIAHEISHAELCQRIGYYKFYFAIPSWFRHGLAMQNDYRPYYSEDTLSSRSNQYRNMPDISNLVSDDQFYTGSQEKVMLNYMVASHTVRNWYSKTRLLHLINEMNAGKEFDESFKH